MDPELQEIAVPVEPTHWWFVARRRTVIGCGRGYMLAGFPASWGRLGVDPAPRAVVERMEASARVLPYRARARKPYPVVRIVGAMRSALGGVVTDGLDT